MNAESGVVFVDVGRYTGPPRTCLRCPGAARFTVVATNKPGTHFLCPECIDELCKLAVVVARPSGANEAEEPGGEIVPRIVGVDQLRALDLRGALVPMFQDEPVTYRTPHGTYIPIFRTERALALASEQELIEFDEYGEIHDVEGILRATPAGVRFAVDVARAGPRTGDGASSVEFMDLDPVTLLAEIAKQRKRTQS